MLKTHLKINQHLCGKVITQKEEYAEVLLSTTKEMLADEYGLIHGGFTFGAADYAAMVAVNDPTVLLVAVNVTFLAPIRLGEEIYFQAKVIENDGKKSLVLVTATVAEKKVFEGEFKTYTPTTHILER